ncbi:hypothetical protein Pint_26076 [Pistacia integerrima]|uniref:Uncharacterized protein n=1 Tax=Pistacia integerrima TaxID=434235 RepID=A0ACC0YGF9_9ROSI|nr:hypothetical protein Pint_26076 [Pistacia integerrima]
MICDESVSKTCQERTEERKQSLKGVGLDPYTKLSTSVPSQDEVSTRFAAISSRFADGDLLVNRDGYRIVNQKESGALLPIEPFDNQLKLEDIERIRLVGEGNSSMVHLAQHKYTGQFLAVKVVKVNLEVSSWKKFAQMLKVIQSSPSPYVVVFYQLFYNEGAISIILEYMDGGSLANFLKKVKSIPEVYLAAIFKQVLKGLLFLHHKKHIIHRDLKSTNLLINHSGEVKISDFDVSATVAYTAGQANTFIGTYNYMSPERISGGSYGHKSDIWSLGIVMLECACGQFPYSPVEQEEGWTSFYEVMEAIVDQPPPCAPQGQFSSEFCSFISACLQKEPSDRQSAKELLEHRFMNMYDDSDVDLSAYFTNVGSPLTTF